MNGLVLGALMRPFPEPYLQQVAKDTSKDASREDTKINSDNDHLRQRCDRGLHETGSQPMASCVTSGRWCSLLGVSLLKNHSFLFFCIAGFGMEIGHTGILSFLPLRVVEVGVSKQKAALLTSIYAACSGVSRCVMGIVGDKFPHHRPLMSGISVFLTGILAVFSVFLTQYWMLACYGVLFGAISGENDHS